MGSGFNQYDQIEMPCMKKYHDKTTLFNRPKRTYPPLFLIACVVTIAMNLTLSLVIIMGYDYLIETSRLPMIFIQDAIFLLYLTAREFKRK